MLISDALYKQVLHHTGFQYEALVQGCEVQRPAWDARLRTDMDQMRCESRVWTTQRLEKQHYSPDPSLLPSDWTEEVLVLPRAEQLLQASVQPYVRSILEALMEPTSRGFSEVREVFSRELVEVSKNTLNGGGQELLGEQMERLSMLAFHPVKMQSCYEQVEQLNLDGLQQRFDISSPSVFVQRAQILMREQMDNAVYTFEQLLSQIIIPYMLQHLTPSCSPELPKFKELIFEDFSRFLLVENVFEEVVLHSVTKDIMMAVKEAAVQRRHNLYRDSMVLTNSDPNLHLLGEAASVDWAARGSLTSAKRRRQVVSMIQLDGVPLEYESCMESPDSVHGIRDLINPMVEVTEAEEGEADRTEAALSAMVTEDGPVERKLTPPGEGADPPGRGRGEAAAIEQAIQEIEIAVQDTELDDAPVMPAPKRNEGWDEARPIRNGLGGVDANAEKMDNFGEEVAARVSDVVCEI
ncbi:hypothetical protein NHX12_027569 [Muraenolepis orangiensis]|uniref:Niban 1/2/3 domain-containing protein n=1 Tax=Muraenolepis orangiensis TaxID=630683 RepID=A0A9Q0EH79_9TELE|nr:hypothetical protein NHX12_027569 [Muraenolepis orangiensis]